MTDAVGRPCTETLLLTRVPEVADADWRLLSAAWLPVILDLWPVFVFIPVDAQCVTWLGLFAGNQKVARHQIQERLLLLINALILLSAASDDCVRGLLGWYARPRRLSLVDKRCVAAVCCSLLFLIHIQVP